MREHEYSSITAYSAVVDGMRQAVSMQIMRRGRRSPVDVRSQQLDSYEQDMFTFLKQVTKSNCYESSQHTLIYVFQRYPQMFDIGFVLGTYGERAMDEHGVFVVHAVKDGWFIGAPANYGTDTLFHQPIYEVTLDSALHQLMKISPGNWPSIQELSHAFDQHPHELAPLFDPHYPSYIVPVIEKEANKVYFRRSEKGIHGTQLISNL